MCSCAYKAGHSQELLEAVKLGELKKCEDLLGRGADVNVKDKDGKTPLHIAAENDYEEIVKLLIKKGADVNLVDNDGNTPLHLAIKKNNYFIIKELIRAGAKLDTKNKENKTPYDIAKEIGDQDVLKLINSSLNSKPGRN